MKKYDKINFYFNTVPRTYALVAAIWFGLTGLGTVILGIANMEYFNPWSIIGGLLYAALLCGLFIYIYISQFTLVNARIGKHLKKNYGMSKEELEVAFAQINNEMAYPRFIDALPKKKHCSFFVTANWMIGTDGVMIYRANAVKLCNITSIQKNYLVRRNRGGAYYFFIIEVRDIKNQVYHFYLRSEENRDRAYDFLMNMFNQQ